MDIIKQSSYLFMLTVFSSVAFAESANIHTTTHTTPSNSNYNVIAKSEKDPHLTMDHGSDIYQSAKLESKWRTNNDNEGQFVSELDYWIGTDNNKLFIKSDFNKKESESSSYDTYVLYSRNIANFWDVQAGWKYERDNQEDSDSNFAVVSLHGLAPYFFETEAYLAMASQQVNVKLKMTRDVLLTQKLIAEPFIETDVILRDKRDEHTKKTGIDELNLGAQLRYEINKKVMPFMELSYEFDRADRQSSADDEKDWLYGAGITFKF